MGNVLNMRLFQGIWLRQESNKQILYTYYNTSVP